MSSDKITVLWYGGGQDSSAILFKSVYDEAFRQKYIQGELIVICSDTGNEFPETYAYIDRIVKPFCKAHNILFTHITPDMGFHPKTWQSLQYQFALNRGVMSVAFPKTCTDNLKLKPCYNYLESYLKERYNFDNTKPKAAYYQYLEKFGKLRVIIGFGADESERAGALSKKSNLLFELDPVAKKDYSPVFVQKCIEKIYPLIDIGYTRMDCQNQISDYGLEVPPPSNCMYCPFANEIEIVYLYKHYPQEFEKWVSYEAAKIAKDAQKGKALNFGVKGNKTLVEYVGKALLKHGHMSNQELYDYRFSHGHCVKSRY